MGSEASEAQKGGVRQNEWSQYEAELAKDKPSEVQPYTVKELAYL
jgi:hypothetical protein